MYDLIISYFGILGGYLFSKFFKDEIKDYFKIITIVRWIILTTIIVIFSYYSYSYLNTIIIILTLLIIELNSKRLYLQIIPLTSCYFFIVNGKSLLLSTIFIFYFLTFSLK
jgi:hypothetical protein